MIAGDAVPALAGVILALAPPAVALFRHLGRGLRLTERVLLGLGLAPFALTLVAVVPALVLRAPVGLCFWQAEFLWVVAALWPAGRGADRLPDPDAIPARGTGFPAVAAVASALGLTALVALPLLSVPFVRMWSDAWFHAAATIEVARHGVPPENPYFAGVRLHYFWLHHFLLALLGVPGRASPFLLQGVLNMWAAVVLCLALAQLAYRAFGRAAAMWVGVIALLGLNPLGWVFWIVRGAVGDTRGLEGMVSLLASTNGAAMALSYGFPFAHVSLLNRFWTGTAMTPAIALTVATAWSVARALERPSRVAWLRILLFAAALMAMHPALGALSLAVLALGLVPSLLAREGRGAAIASLTALIAAIVASLPYQQSWAVPGATPGAALGIYTRNVWSLSLAIGPWWLVIVPALGIGWARGTAARFTIAVALSAVAMSLLLVLPELNTDKMFYLAWVFLAPPAAAGVLWWTERLRLPAIARLTVVAALVVPSSGLYTMGTMSDSRSPGVLVRGDTPAARALPLATEAEAEAYRFMRERLPDDAVVVEQPRPTVNEPVPVLGARRVFCGALDVYLFNVFGGGHAGNPAMSSLYEEFRVRRDIQTRLFTSGELDEAQRLYLANLSAPLYLLVRRADVADAVWYGFLRQPDWEQVFENHEMRVFRFSPRDGRAAAAPRTGTGRAAPRPAPPLLAGDHGRA